MCATAPLLGFRHVALDVESRHLHGAVGAHGDGLLEVAGELAFAVVRYLDFTLLARLDGCLGVFGYRTAARGDGLVDDQRLLAHVGIGEGTGHDGILLREGTEVVGGLVKLDLCRLLGHSHCHAANQQQRHKYCSFHHLSFHLFHKLLLHFHYHLFGLDNHHN